MTEYHWTPTAAAQAIIEDRQHQLESNLMCNTHRLDSRYGCVNCPSTWKKPALFIPARSGSV